MKRLSLHLLALLALAMGLGMLGGCTKKTYICAAYQSAFQLDMAAYKRNQAMDSLAMAADTSLDIDVIAVLAERIRKNQDQESADADSTPTFAANSVVKNQYLIIKTVSRKRKNKMLATVPMVTVFPASSDSSATPAEGGAPAPTDGNAEPPPADQPATPADQPAPTTPEATPKADEQQPQPEPQQASPQRIGGVHSQGRGAYLPVGAPV